MKPFNILLLTCALKFVTKMPLDVVSLFSRWIDFSFSRRRCSPGQVSNLHSSALSTFCRLKEEKKFVRKSRKREELSVRYSSRSSRNTDAASAMYLGLLESPMLISLVSKCINEKKKQRKKGAPECRCTLKKKSSGQN